MSNILFIILPYPSHLMASFPYAQFFSNNGYQVVFTGHHSMKELIEEEGYVFYTFEYIKDLKINSVKTFLGIFLKSLLSKSYLIRRYREFLTHKQAVKSLVKHFNPSNVFIDQCNTDYYFLCRMAGIEASLINTRLSTKKVKNIPPLNSCFIPNHNSFFSTIYCELLWFIHLKQRRLSQLVVDIAFIGKSQRSLIRQTYEKEIGGWNVTIDREHSFAESVKRIPTIILSPPDLEFPLSKVEENEIYFHQAHKRNQSKYYTQEYFKLTQEIKAKKNTKVVYATFGTLSYLRGKLVAEFLERLSVSITEMGNILLVISKGGSNIDMNIQKNVYLFDFLPQQDFLKYVDVTVSHGGLGTIKECFDLDIPMYLLPMNSHSDNNGNAARVQLNGYGLMGSLKHDKIECIKNKLSTLIQKPKFKP